jgi:hypothetical protein
MKSFIAPVYFQTNSISSEKLTGGLLVSSGKKNWLAFSSEKVALAGKLGGIDLKKLLDHTLELFSNKVKKVNDLTKDEESQLFQSTIVLTSQYLEYLNKYSKGVIQFAAPKPISTVASDEQFQKLFELYVGEELEVKKKKDKPATFHAALKKTLETPGLTEKADIDYVLTPQLVKGILKPAHVTLITKNGALEIVQAIDFTNAPKTLVEHAYEFEVMLKHMNTFESEKKLKKGSYKTVINKPIPGTEQETIFNMFHESSKGSFSIIEPAELDAVVENILKKPHTKFSDFAMAL